MLCYTHILQDYSARAKDFNLKKTKLKALRRKAIYKSPDEFYFGMLSRKGPLATGKNTTGTVNGDRGNTQLGQETVKLLKTQDLGYIRTMRNKAMKEVKEAERIMRGIKWAGNAVVFVDTPEEQVDKLEKDRGFRFGALDEMGHKLSKTKPLDINVAIDKEAESKSHQKVHENRALRLSRRLEAAKTRLKVLTDAEDGLDLQRAKMAKSMTTGSITKEGRRFKIRERKR